MCIYIYTAYSYCLTHCNIPYAISPQCDSCVDLLPGWNEFIQSCRGEPWLCKMRKNVSLAVLNTQQEFQKIYVCSVMPNTNTDNIGEYFLVDRLIIDITIHIRSPQRCLPFIKSRKRQALRQPAAPSYSRSPTAWLLLRTFPGPTDSRRPPKMLSIS